MEDTERDHSLYFSSISLYVTLIKVCGEHMNLKIFTLVIILSVAGCAEQLVPEMPSQGATIPSPDYQALEEEYRQQQNAIEISLREGPFDGMVAVIRIVGILDSEDVMPIAAKFREVGEDPSVEGVILWIDSPGGSVAAVTQIAYEVEKLKNTKPVVAYTGGIAASGGYYLMSVCDRIVVRPDAEVGSIGVIFVHVNASGYYSQFGFDIEVIKTGEHKDAGADWRALDADERQYITDSVYDAFYRFIYTVARGRDLTTDYVEKYADGFTWYGKEAVDWGFADILGNFDDAVREMERLRGLKRAELVFVEITDEGEFREYDWESVLYLYVAG